MEKRLERILNFGHAIDHLVLLIFPTAVIALAREFGLPYETLLPLTFGCFVAFGVGALPAGWLGDHWGRRPMLLLFFFGTGLSCLLAGFATTPFHIGVALTLIGAFASIYHPVGYAVLSGLNPARIGKIMGINGLWGNLGVAFAALITGAITEWVSWRAAFFLPGIACLLGGVYYFAVTRHTSEFAATAGRTSIPLSVPLLWRVSSIFMALSLLGNVVFSATTVVMPKLFEQELPDLPSGTFGIGLMVCLVFSVAALAQTFVGGLMDRFSIRSVLIPVVAAQVPLVVLAGYVGGWPLVLVAWAMMFVIFGQAPICEVIVARYTPAPIRARVNALRFAISCGLGATAIPLAAYLYAVRQDFSLLFLVLGGLCVVILAACLFMPGDNRIGGKAIPAE
jgi:MFS family permease